MLCKARWPSGWSGGRNQVTGRCGAGAFSRLSAEKRGTLGLADLNKFIKLPGTWFWDDYGRVILHPVAYASDGRALALDCLVCMSKTDSG